MNPEDEKVDPEAAPANEAPEREPERSDLQQGLEGLGNAITGIAAQLLGSKLVGKAPERPAISPVADEALRDLGDSVGRALNAAGHALSEHPTAPAKAFEDLREHVADPVEVAEGSAPLTEGLKSLATGIEKVAVGVLDAVAPRRPRRGGEAAEAGEAAEPPESTGVEVEAEPALEPDQVVRPKPEG